MASNRKSAIKRRTDHEHEDPASFNVRFDYSNAYLENVYLENQLEDHASLLHREKYRMCVETDELLKKTKQNVDEMVQLKNAVKNRDPFESSNRVSKSADLKRRQRKDSVTQNSQSESNEHNNIALNSAQSGSNSDAADSVKELVDKGATGQTLSKPLNTLTMFLLSLQTFKRNSNQAKKMEATVTSEQTTNSRRNSAPPVPVKTHSKRASSFHARDLKIKETPEGGLVDESTKPQYGIHVKRDHSRSRRKLEEISKLEQNSKFGYVNKYEERRKKLLAECKDTKSVNERIQHFLKNVDDFKKEAMEENSLEKVLIRSRSAQLNRRNTFAW